MSNFTNFFTKGEIRLPNGSTTTLTNVFEKDLVNSAKITFSKIPPPKKIVIDAKTKQFFEKDVKNALKDVGNELKDVAVDLKDNLKNGLSMGKKIGDLMNNLLESANTPLLLPILGAVGVFVLIQTANR